jgi:hypothetical protein
MLSATVRNDGVEGVSRSIIDQIMLRMGSSVSFINGGREFDSLRRGLRLIVRSRTSSRQ